MSPKVFGLMNTTGSMNELLGSFDVIGHKGEIEMR